MKALYVDKELLNDRIKESGLKKSFIAEQLGISMAAFYKKLNGVTPFRIPEVYYLCFLLNITGDDKPKIFYPQS